MSSVYDVIYKDSNTYLIYFTVHFKDTILYQTTYQLLDSLRDFITVLNNKCLGTLSMDVDKDSVQNVDL